MLDWPDVLPLEWATKAADTSDKNLATFKASIRAAARGLWSGKSDLLDFVDMMYSAIRRGYEQAWREGAAECGIGPKERTPEEQAILDEMVVANQGYVVRYGDWIETHNQASGAKLQPVLDRSELWVNRYNEVKARAQVMSCQNQKLVWRYGPTEHCADCRKLNGRVYRAEIWRRYSLRPQSPDLACRGYRCQCRLEPTDLPVTPGHPPALGR